MTKTNFNKKEANYIPRAPPPHHRSHERELKIQKWSCRLCLIYAVNYITIISKLQCFLFPRRHSISSCNVRIYFPHYTFRKILKAISSYTCESNKCPHHIYTSINLQEPLWDVKKYILDHCTYQKMSLCCFSRGDSPAALWCVKGRGPFERDEVLEIFNWIFLQFFYIKNLKCNKSNSATLCERACSKHCVLEK